MQMDASFPGTSETPVESAERMRQHQCHEQPTYPGNEDMSCPAQLKLSYAADE